MREIVDVIDCRHANRITVGVEDVKLVARRNTALFELLSTEAQKNGLALDALKIKPPKPRPKPAAPKKGPAAKKDVKGKGKAKDRGMDVDGESAPEASERSADDAPSGGDSEDEEPVKKKPKAVPRKTSEKKKK
ncbi:hypothetical protein P7C70_g1768, partial [Phenoliferia sp. Uapishka_3]